MSQGPLSGVTILDLTRALAGPFATMLLAGLGARVIHIEESGPGNGRSSAPFLGEDGIKLRATSSSDFSLGALIRLRGKESVTLNLKHGEAGQLFNDLVKHADVVVENFTRGTAERLGVGYSAAKAARPDIIYCSISGFGQEGNPGGGKAMDNVIQALSGVMMTSGGPDQPPVRMGVPFADLGAPLFAVIGIVSALYHRAVTGKGQYLDVSMLGCMTALQSVEPFKVLEMLGVPMRTGNTVPRLVPFGCYQASNGHIVICCAGDTNFVKMAEVMQRSDLAEDPRFHTQAARLDSYTELDELVNHWLSDQTVEDAVELLESQGIPAAPVRSPGEAQQDPRVLHRKEVVPLSHPQFGSTAEIWGPGVPILFSETPAIIPDQASTLGQYNEAVYGNLLGRSPEELARLKAEGAI